MLGNESSMLILMLRMKVPGDKNSKEWKFHLWDFRSQERKFSGTKVSVTAATKWYIWAQFMSYRVHRVQCWIQHCLLFA